MWLILLPIFFIIIAFFVSMSKEAKNAPDQATSDRYKKANQEYVNDFQYVMRFAKDARTCNYFTGRVRIWVDRCGSDFQYSTTIYTNTNGYDEITKEIVRQLGKEILPGYEYSWPYFTKEGSFIFNVDSKYAEYALSSLVSSIAQRYFIPTTNLHCLGKEVWDIYI